MLAPGLGGRLIGHSPSAARCVAPMVLALPRRLLSGVRVVQVPLARARLWREHAVARNRLNTAVFRKPLARALDHSRTQGPQSRIDGTALPLPRFHHQAARLCLEMAKRSVPCPGRAALARRFCGLERRTHRKETSLGSAAAYFRYALGSLPRFAMRPSFSAMRMFVVQALAGPGISMPCRPCVLDHMAMRLATWERP